MGFGSRTKLAIVTGLLALEAIVAAACGGKDRVGSVVTPAQEAAVTPPAAVVVKSQFYDKTPKDYPTPAIVTPINIYGLAPTPEPTPDLVATVTAYGLQNTALAQENAALKAQLEQSKAKPTATPNPPTPTPEPTPDLVATIAGELENVSFSVIRSAETSYPLLPKTYPLGYGVTDWLVSLGIERVNSNSQVVGVQPFASIFSLQYISQFPKLQTNNPNTLVPAFKDNVMPYATFRPKDVPSDIFSIGQNPVVLTVHNVVPLPEGVVRITTSNGEIISVNMPSIPGSKNMIPNFSDFVFDNSGASFLIDTNVPCWPNHGGWGGISLENFLQRATPSTVLPSAERVVSLSSGCRYALENFE